MRNKWIENKASFISVLVGLLLTHFLPFPHPGFILQWLLTACSGMSLILKSLIQVKSNADPTLISKMLWFCHLSFNVFAQGFAQWGSNFLLRLVHTWLMHVYVSLLSYGKGFQRGRFKVSCLCLNRHNYKEQLHFQRGSVLSCSGGVRAIKTEHFLGAYICIFCKAEIPSIWGANFICDFFSKYLLFHPYLTLHNN